MQLRSDNDNMMVNETGQDGLRIEYSVNVLHTYSIDTRRHFNVKWLLLVLVVLQNAKIYLM